MRTTAPALLVSSSSNPKLVAVAAYALLAMISLVWGLSYDLFYRHEITMEIQLGATGEGSTFVQVRNTGRVVCENPKLEADDRWFFRPDRIGLGGVCDARLVEFDDRFWVPRPALGSPWEALLPRASPHQPAADYRPTWIRVFCEAGSVAVRVTL